MSSGMADANKERPAGTRRNRMSFCVDGPAARRASGPADSGTKERVAIWDAVSAYIQEHLLVHKGVWIPTFGSFDTISTDIRTANGTVTLQWPVFHLARNLRAMCHLKSYKESLPAHKEVEPLKYSEVAAAASVSWQRGKACIQSTVYLLSSCLQNGENVAFVLKDIGVLLISGMSFQMKYYYDFLEKVSGKEKLRKVILKVSCRFLHGLGSPMTLALPSHGPPGPGQLLGPCKCCSAVSPPCLGPLWSQVPQP
ncbi:coiled-coil domain-containing protein 81-like [Numida meleagris]|uniref:coiled-coil domain-containing protein 81-like n=1 Tax=Numida meleagris TaxID=8996 RepID=UPI000B3E1BDD|nr:coiled-coil domain-containing protein 81-like [Numida meleagris]